jgi:hypothetical protein
MRWQLKDRESTQVLALYAALAGGIGRANMPERLHRLAAEPGRFGLPLTATVSAWPIRNTIPWFAQGLREPRKSCALRALLHGSRPEYSTK